ncbi:MAG: hypothetical protein ACOX1S_12420 [Anaerostipes sp.]|jgi:hypothetical protein
MINEAIAYLDTQVKEKPYLGPEGIFVTEEEYPKFVRQELIVNAITHRLCKASSEIPLKPRNSEFFTLHKILQVVFQPVNQIVLFLGLLAHFMQQP